jgi:hypothetical protein
MTNDTNAANNSIPMSDVDPKQLVDDYSSTKLPPKGFHAGGLDDNNGSIFMPVTDNTDATDIMTGSKIPASVLPPRLGKRLSESQ